MKSIKQLFLEDCLKNAKGTDCECEIIDENTLVAKHVSGHEYIYQWEEELYHFLNSNMSIPKNMYAFSFKRQSAHSFYLQFPMEDKMFRLLMVTGKDKITLSGQYRHIHFAGYSFFDDTCKFKEQTKAIIPHLFSLWSEYISKHPSYRLRISTGKLTFRKHGNFF